MLFLDVPGVFDYAGPDMARDFAPLADVAFPQTEKGQRPVLSFRSSIAQPTDASVYASPATSQRCRARLEVRMARYPFAAASFIPYCMPVYPGAPALH